MVRTRFAPSPTGYIHVGNLRTAIYSYLIAKRNNGKFILRIEDTDQSRSDNKFLEYIYNSLKFLGLEYDEGPNKEGEFGPYIQSERIGLYKDFAEYLVKIGKAYYCFCPEAKTDLDTYKEECNYKVGIGYNGHCRELSKEEIEKNLKEGKPYVIRQKMPKDEIVEYTDEVYGNISFSTNELDDQVLIKSDGYPTYNFANVIDDHLMNITHIIRGNEYLSSTPKYVLLYKAFNWEIPKFVHLPLIFIKDEEGKEQKLSKRFGCSSFDNLIKEGYLKEAIINYVVMLGWNSKTNQELYTLKELENIFEIKDIGKSTKVLFDKTKLDWFNHQYILKLSNEEFIKYCKDYCELDINWEKVCPLIKEKIKNFSELFYEMSIINVINKYQKNLIFDYKKKDYTEEDIIKFIEYLENIETDLTSEGCYQKIKEYSMESHINFGSLMHIYRVMLTGRKNIIISATDITELIGITQVKERLRYAKSILT